MEGPLDDPFRVGEGPIGIAGDRVIWVANNASNSVTRIDPDSGVVVPITVGESPTAVAVAEDAVWVTNSGEGTVSRIDPETNKVVSTIPIGNAPSGIVLADGLLWVTVQAP